MSLIIVDRISKIISKCIFLIIGIFLSSWIFFSIIDYCVWSISIYRGPSILALKPHEQIGRHPVLSASDVRDLKAKIVADPFMVRTADHWYMFFEVKPKNSEGRIGLATSKDGISWKYEKIVLHENFHLSYPYVFEWQNAFYMIPESAAAGAIRLYKASEFPYKWKFEREILKGRFGDPSICFKDGKFWLFVLDDKNRLCLFFADALTGPWTEHPKNPLIRNDMDISRPGGRLLLLDDKIIRIAQDCDPDYGNSIRAFQIDLLSTSEYKEHEITDKPLLAATGSGWNKDGMHHLDAHKLDADAWLACVDGKTCNKELDLSKGLKKLKAMIKSASVFSKN